MACLYSQAPLQRLERALRPVAYLVVLPLFALANAGIRLPGSGPLQLLVHPVGLGVALGLMVGKPLGIMAFTWLAVRLRLVNLPRKASWRQMLGVSWLAGIGFTMSLFISNLAFRDAELVTEARMAILVASLLTAVGAYAYIRLWPSS